LPARAHDPRSAPSAFDGTAGFEAANGQGLSIGFNYNLQLSEHRTGHGVFGTLRYEF
jgi:hypothetical protein